ncbi:hypothetical protein [Spirosoma fluviale]|uniref:hypothetical protein n=1 Tax=Spirosoma fluviale TaxID=1597977 RepID=UPI001C535FA9|nr:hypothetical protein [Spirosoma fluviale]
MIIRIAAGKESQALSGVEQLYKQYNPGLPLDYKFLENSSQSQLVAYGLRTFSK